MDSSALEEWLIAKLAEQTGLTESDLDPQEPFTSFGLSSRAAVVLVGELQDFLRRTLPPTLVWEYPTIRALSAHLADSAPTTRFAGRRQPGDPVAVVGIGCRLPGVHGPDDFWTLLASGGDAVGRAGERHELLGEHPPHGLLNDVDLFDEEFFSISAREARYVDPQQRILLETAWEALEHAGIPPHALRGTQAGVFVGVSNSDYGRLQTAEPALLSSYSGTGQSLTVAANRISYFLDLRGPSIAVDTACSSSLVAVHLACRSLRSGESTLALAGGVNLILAKDATDVLSQAGMLSPSGRCQTFDASADGYVRSEGCGVVVLKTLKDAERDGDRVLAVIRGSAVNQDGLSNGLTAPNGLAQRDVIRAALRDADIAPASVGYVEAHGTGTPLGDPLETRALRTVLEAGRPGGRPVLLGSVKANIGHTESAAGIAGLIKVVLMLQHRQVPSQVHLTRINPAIELGETLRIPRETTRWPEWGAPRVAGVSSFGFGGTNAHVVLQEAPPVPETTAAAEHQDVRPVQLLALSARSSEARSELLRSHLGHLRREEGAALEDVCHTANTGRSHHAHRVAISAATRQELLDRAEQWLATGRAPGASAGHGKGPGKLAFLFGGQGSEYLNMGRELYVTSPLFRRELTACSEILRDTLGRPIPSILFPLPQESDLLRRTQYTQPVLFAFQYALATLWRSWGVEPDYLLGHSLGSLSAACVAGVFGLEDGLRLAAERGRAVQESADAGRMAVARADEKAVREVIDPLQSRHLVRVAAVNGPENTVVSGDPDGVAAACTALAERGIDTHGLDARFAFHSPMMAAARDAFTKVARSVDYTAPGIPLVSDLTGEVFDAGRCPGADHWERHLVEPVRFADALRTLEARECAVFLETGPGGSLVGMGRRQAAAGQWLPSLHRGTSDWRRLTESLGRLYADGLTVDWPGFDQDYQRTRVALPTYPFRRGRHWLPRHHTVTSARTPASHALPEEGPVAVDIQPTDPAATDPVLTDLIAVVSRLLESGRPVDPDASFLELGADSLTLMQMLQEVQRGFRLTLPISRLFEDVNTLRRLATHIREEAPGDVLAARPAQPAEAPSNDPTASSAAPQAVGLPPAPGRRPGPNADRPADAAVEQFLTVHAQVMGQAYELLQGRPGHPAAPMAEAPRRSEPGPGIPVAPRGTYVAFQPATPAAPKPADSREAVPVRREYVADLVRRFCEQTKGSKEQAIRERSVHADVRHAPQPYVNVKETRYPLVVSRSQGSRVWDVDDNEYIDLTMGFGVNFFGHGEPFINEAITRQLASGIQLGPHPALAGEVAQLICELTGKERAVFCNTGSEAVMVAIRLARAVSGRTKIVIFAGSYHGSADTILARQDLESGSGEAVPLAPGIPEAVADHTIVLPYGDPSALRILRDRLPELAAVLVEPVQSRAPDLQPRDFLHDLRRMTEEAGVALVFDEVITGFRTHPAGAQAIFGVEADLAVYGKVIGGGLPIGAVAGAARYLDAIDGGAWTFGDAPYPAAVRTFFTGTFCKHPLALAAGRAVLTEMRKRGPQLQAGVSARVAALAERINGLFEGSSVPIHVVHFGSLFRLRFRDEPPHSETVEVFHIELAAHGVYVWEGRNCFLSTAHTDEDVERVLTAMVSAANAMTTAGFFPGAETIPLETALLSRYPLSHVQRDVWLLGQMGDDHSRAYNESLLFDLHGPLQVGPLQKSVQEVAARHESLRTVFGPDGAEQSVIPMAPLEVPLVDLSGTGDGERNAALRRWLDEQAGSVFDLASGPLVRAAVLRLSGEHHQLHLSAHHTVVDGWSFGILLDEICRCYQAHRDGTEPQLPPAPQFREHVAYLQRVQRGERWQAAEQFWLEQFADRIPALELAAKPARPAKAQARGGRVTVVLDERIAERVAAASQRLGSTPFAVLLSAYACLLHRITGQADLVVGVPVALRERPGSDRIVGNCSNTLPIRSRWAPRTRVADFVGALHRTLLRAYDSCVYPFSALREQLPRDAGTASRLFATTFNLDQEKGSPRLPGLRTAVLTPERRYSKADLGVDVLASGGTYTVSFEYDSDVLEESTVRRYADLYRDVLDALTGDPECAVGRIPLASGVEQDVLPAGGRGKAVPPADGSQQPAAVPPYTAPRGDVERDLVAIWEKVLGRQRIGMDDDFFTLGGNSLLALRVANEARSAMGVEVAVRMVFEERTVAGVARRVAAATADACETGRPQRPEVLPLSYPQQRMWFFGRLQGPSSAYNVPLPLRFTGPLDKAALRAALGDVVARHESLRTRFVERDGVPVQDVLPSREAQPVLVEESVEEAGLRQAVREAAEHTFDLSAEIPLRAWLFALRPEEHVLVVLAHHIAVDGWSLTVLARDLAEAYRARSRGAAPAWPPLPARYTDFTLWQSELAGTAEDPGSTSARQLAYWISTLADAPDQLELPTDRPRPVMSSRRLGTLDFSLDAELHSRLTALAHEQGASFFMVLHAGLAALLTRMGAGTDITVGTPVAGRGDTRFDDVVGCFVNTLVLRTDTSGDPGFRELIGRVREVDLAAYAHQDVPFERLVEELNPSRSMSRHPLFQVMLAFENTGGLALEIEGLRVTPEPVAATSGEFDLTYNVREHARREGRTADVEIELEYSTDLFDHRTAEAISQAFLQLLKALSADPECPVGRIPLASEAERDALLAVGRGEVARSSEADTVVDLFGACVRAVPDAVAVVCGDVRLSYRELDDRAGRLAGVLRARGVGPESRVAILLERSVDLVVAVLGVWKAGAAYVALDLEAPSQRRAAVLADAEPALVVTSTELARKAARPVLPTVFVDDLPDQVVSGGDTQARPVTPPEALAYVIYTSGSTGQPKGVMVSHRSLLSVTAGWDAAYGLSERAKSVLQMANFGFDVFVGDVVRALCSGARLVLCPRELLLQPQELAALMRREETDVAEFVPVVLRHLAEYLRAGGERLPSLRLVLVSSDTIYEGELALIQEALGKETRLINSYGLTEATIDSTYLVHQGAAPGDAHRSLIGGPFPNAEAYVLDARMQVVPEGVPGVLHVGGVGLARGYLGRPDLTAESFVPHPFSGQPGDRLYRTGDLARYRRAAGRLVIEYLGRQDSQVNIRGYRIELGEVETAVRRVTGIGEAVVVDHPAPGGGRRLLAHLAASGQVSEATVLGWHRGLRESLPDYMVPEAFVVHQALPVSRNGKLDRRALRAGDWPEVTAAHPYTAPRDEIERDLVDIWGELLGRQGIGVKDDFFAIGGHSLLAVRMAAQIGHRLGLEVPLSTVFERTSVAELAERLREIRVESHGAVPASPIRPARRTAVPAPEMAVND